MKFNIVLTAILALGLSACGGSGTTASTNTSSSSGSGSSGSSGSGGTTTPTPVTSTYVGYTYLQNLTSASAYTATYTDNGLGVAGSLSFGVTPATIAMTPDANGDGGIAYASPVTASVAIGANAKDTNLPAVAMICQSVSGTGTGSAGKSTDVLFASSATQITSATTLANQTFTFFREDCLQGGTSPATTTGNSLAFDASGNVTVTGNVTISSPTISAAAFTSALNGQAIYSSTSGKYTLFYAYSYTKQNGSISYAIAELDAPGLSGNTKGVLSVWSQQ